MIKIIGPRPSKPFKKWPDFAIIAATPLEFKALQAFLPLGKEKKPLLGGLIKIWQTDKISLLGPIFGAPMALALLEICFACGVKSFIFLGRAGKLNFSTSNPLKLYDLFFPTSFLSDENISPYFSGNIATPNIENFKSIKTNDSLSFGGAIWSNSALFQEEVAKAKNKFNDGALAVDMECAAFAFGAGFLNLNWTAVLIISDELTKTGWNNQAFGHDFKQCVSKASQLIMKVIHKNEP